MPLLTDVGEVPLIDVPLVGKGRAKVVELRGTITLVVTGAVPFGEGAVPDGGRADSVPLLVGNGGNSVGVPGGGPTVVVELTGAAVSTAVPFGVAFEMLPVMTLVVSFADTDNDVILPVGTAPTRVVVLSGTMMLVMTADPLMVTVSRLAVTLANGGVVVKVYPGAVPEMLDVTGPFVVVLGKGGTKPVALSDQIWKQDGRWVQTGDGDGVYLGYRSGCDERCADSCWRSVGVNRRHGPCGQGRTIWGSDSVCHNDVGHNRCRWGQ